MSARQSMPLYLADRPAETAGMVAAHPRRVSAAKFECLVRVEIAAGPVEVATPEGPVSAVAGDAIITDSGGDSWPVPGAHFPDKYRPVSPTVAGASGAYVSVPQVVQAVCMDEPFQVLLPDGRSRLTGKRGDWLVEGSKGNLYVISAAAFARTYRITD